MTWARKDMSEDGRTEGRRRRMRMRRRRSGLHTNSNNPTLKGGEILCRSTPHVNTLFKFGFAILLMHTAEKMDGETQ